MYYELRKFSNLSIYQRLNFLVKIYHLNPKDEYFERNVKSNFNLVFVKRVLKWPNLK